MSRLEAISSYFIMFTETTFKQHKVELISHGKYVFASLRVTFKKNPRTFLIQQEYLSDFYLSSLLVC